MNQDVKQLWIDALLSGNYKQGQGNLKVLGANGDKYCCLGVLCELAREANISTEMPYMDDSDIVSFDGETEFLPPSVMRWAMVFHSDPFVDAYDKSLSMMNDDGASFEQIADVIELYL